MRLHDEQRQGLLEDDDIVVHEHTSLAVGSDDEYSESVLSDTVQNSVAAVAFVVDVEELVVMRTKMTIEQLQQPQPLLLFLPPSRRLLLFPSASSETQATR